jgi:hypothetical protein
VIRIGCTQYLGQDRYPGCFVSVLGFFTDNMESGVETFGPAHNSPSSDTGENFCESNIGGGNH